MGSTKVQTNAPSTPALSRMRRVSAISLAWRDSGPPSMGAAAYGVVGPGVTSPKSRPSGCRAGHAGYESFPFVLPGPALLRRAPGAGRRCWRSGLQRSGRLPLGLALGHLAIEVGAPLR